jgi:alpha-amylase
MVRAIQELRGIKNEASYKPFGVGECWDSDRTIIDWLDETNAWSDNPACAFDFPLRSRLRDLCQSYGYCLKNLMGNGAVYTDRPMQAVTFVENHDVERDDPIVTDKMMAYAFILTHEGYPCVFWRDYYNYGLAKENNPAGIAALVGIHEQFAGGPTSVLYADDDLYIMQRSGWAAQKGLVFILNNRSSWNGAAVQTQWKNAKFTAVAYAGTDSSVPDDKWTNENGYTDFWAPPRGYAVYVP